MRTIPDEGKKPIESLLNVSKDILGENLRSIYGMGSLGYGGFVEEWSDFDIDIILNENLEINEIEAMNTIQAIMNKNGYLRVDVKCYKLSDLNAETLPYSYGTRNRAVMLCDSAILIYGENISHLVNRPSVEDLRSESLNLVQNLLAKDENWWSTRPLDDTAALLALPARLLYTSESGQVTHKANAIDYLFTGFDKEIPVDLRNWIIWARACRSFKGAQNLPDELLQEALVAAKNQLEWVESTLLNHYGETVS